MASYCQHCGNAIFSGSNFCTRCGAAIPTQPFVPGRPLSRPIIGRRLAGVCIGLAQAYGWDLAMIRVLALIGLFCSGGLVAVAYIACWIGIPEEIPSSLPPVEPLS